MRARDRRYILAAHVTTTAVWLGALTTILIAAADPTRLLVLLTCCVFIALTTGLVLAWPMRRQRWLRTHAGLGVLVAALGAATACTGATGQPVTVLRGLGVTALTIATVVGVVKPKGRRSRRPRHSRRVIVGTYALRVLDRAARTALQVVLGYLVAAHTIGGVDWRTAVLAAILAVAIALLQGLVDLPQITFLGVWGDILGRAIRTAAQVALGTVGANAILITDIPWPTVLSAAGLAAATSIVTSLIALPIGPASVKGTPEIVDARPVAPAHAAPAV